MEEVPKRGPKDKEVLMASKAVQHNIIYDHCKFVILHYSVDWMSWGQVLANLDEANKKFEFYETTCKIV